MKNKTMSLKLTTDKLKSQNLNKQEKNQQWWEELPMTYEDWDSKKRIPETKEDFLENKKVLEIGCGSGVVSCLFARNGAKVTAVDITKQAINLVKTNAKLQGLNINPLQQDAEKLTFAKENFDYLFSWGVLHHSQNPLDAFKQVERVLKKSGSGLIMVYNKNSARYYINGLNWLILKGKIFKGYNLKTVQDFYTDGYYHRHFTPNELKKELEKLGLRCTKVFTTHMGHRMLPFAPLWFEKWIKENYGWLLVAEFEKV